MVGLVNPSPKQREIFRVSGHGIVSNRINHKRMIDLNKKSSLYLSYLAS